MTSDDWQRHWRDYRGPVRVVLDDLSILHGVARSVRDGDIYVTSEGGADWHPWQRVWPSRWAFSSERRAS